MALIRSLYDWTLSLAATKHALLAMMLVSFTESSFFPIPPEVMLLPMVLARPDKAFLYATCCLVASVAGGLLGYAIGHSFYDYIGQPIVDAYGLTDKMQEFIDLYNANGAWVVAGGALTPIPYKAVTIASGIAGMDILKFTIASLAARGLRYFVIAALLWKFGAPIRDFIEKRLGLVFSLGMILLVGGFIALRYI